MFLTILLILTGLISGRCEAASAKAIIQGTAEGSKISGVVTFNDSPEGLQIAAEIAGVPSGNHGFHIHEYGDIGNMGKAAGGHYNPMNHDHGHVVNDGLDKAHAGDLGNITVQKGGTGELAITVPGLTVTGGSHSVAGRAVIVHEKVDDFGQPTGNAGSRIAAGIIVITGN